MPIEVGQPAPGFSLFDTEQKMISLSDQAGKNVLLLFFPQSFTGVCTKELCTIRDDISRYSNAKATVLAISVDSVFTLKKFKEDQHFGFTLLSDYNKEVSAAYDSLVANWILDMKGVSKRAAFIIDREGIIRYAEILDNAGLLPDFNAINKVLDSLN